MKKYISVFLLMILTMTLCGCSSKAQTPEAESSSTETSSTKDTSAKASETETISENASAAEMSSSTKIDLDLTLLSSTMVYSEVYNIMYSPSEYIGKIIRMKGIFSVYHDDINNYNYYACIISDATACCQSGIEFILKGDPAFPDDYPLEGSEITVTGEFQIYYEGEAMYCHLIDATLS